jgi:hypothetical protein
MNAVMIGGTLGPVPTFSPSLIHGAVTPAEIGLAWKIVPASAITCACWRASAVSCPSTLSGGAPTLARVWFTIATNCASSAAGLSGAAETRPAPATRNVEMTESSKSIRALRRRLVKLVSSPFVPLLAARAVRCRPLGRRTDE